MNWPTVIVAALIAAVFLWIVVGSIRNRKKGKASCSCGSSCAGCSLHENCHPHTS